MCGVWIGGITGPSEPSAKGTSDGPTEAYPLARPEEAVTFLLCLLDDA